eukprot:g23550.t1
MVVDIDGTKHRRHVAPKSKPEKMLKRHDRLNNVKSTHKQAEGDYQGRAFFDQIVQAESYANLIGRAWAEQNAHHYEPVPGNPDPLSDADANLTSGIHARRVLSLKAPKRIFFSATLRNEPDFDFGLRPAITAGVIKDYTVMVPVLTEGDPRPRPWAPEESWMTRSAIVYPRSPRKVEEAEEEEALREALPTLLGSPRRGRRVEEAEKDDKDVASGLVGIGRENA